MVSRLVLVRHAKAQEPETGMPDLERQLTVAGQCSIEARYPFTLQLLPDDARGLHVWCSPAQRARQTADVVLEALGLPSAEIKESLYANDPDAFLAELSAQQGTVIAVGHNPFMENLYERLSGSAQRMKPGAIASFDCIAESDESLRESARLEWFVQAPPVALWQTIADVEEGLFALAARIDRCNAAVLDNMDDPESLHRYRISLEMAHAMLGFVKSYCKRKPYKRALRNIEGLLRQTRRLRDFDVLLEVVEPNTHEGRTLGRAGMAEREDFHAKLDSLATQRMIERVTRYLRDIPWRASVLMDGLDNRVLAQRLLDMQTEFEGHFSHVPYDSQHAVFELRKEARALQYVANGFQSCLPDSAADIGRRAELIQERLGELCDCWNNARFIVTVCGPSAISIASRFIVQADAIVDDLKTGRAHGLSISDS